MSQGFPLRPDRNAFGPSFLDTAPVKDPTTQLAAAQFNLLCWQAAGMGILSPRAFVWFTATGDGTLIGRGEAWNPLRLTGGAYAPPDIEGNATGDYNVLWPASVPDMDGDSQVVAFSFAHAFVVNGDPTVARVARAAVSNVTPSLVRVVVADGSNVLQDGSDVVLFVW